MVLICMRRLLIQEKQTPGHHKLYIVLVGGCHRSFSAPSLRRGIFHIDISKTKQD